MQSRIFDEETINSVLATLERGKLFRYDCENSEESETSLLEQEIAEFLGFKYALAVNSCSSALFLALITANIGHGDEVLIPAFTFIAVPSAVVHAGAVPKLVEVDEDFMIDCDDLERKISPKTNKDYEKV